MANINSFKEGVFYEYTNRKELLQIRISVLIFVVLAVGIVLFLIELKKSTILYLINEKLQTELLELSVNQHFESSEDNQKRMEEIKEEIDRLAKEGLGLSFLPLLSLSDYSHLIFPLILSFVFASFSMRYIKKNFIKCEGLADGRMAITYPNLLWPIPSRHIVRDPYKIVGIPLSALREHSMAGVKVEEYTSGVITVHLKEEYVKHFPLFRKFFCIEQGVLLKVFS